MKITSLKSLFAVAIMGAALTGCSTPTKTEEAPAAQTEATQLPEITPKAVVAPVAAMSIDSMSIDELKGFVAGKVVQFDFDRSEIKQDFFETIRANALLMSKDSSLKLTIGGHCDERGSREYNLALGERRGIAVRDALVAEGIAASRIDVISYGEDSPVDEAHTEAAWEKNRRAEFNY